MKCIKLNSKENSLSIGMLLLFQRFILTNLLNKKVCPHLDFCQNASFQSLYREVLGLTERPLKTRHHEHISGKPNPTALTKH